MQSCPDATGAITPELVWRSSARRKPSTHDRSNDGNEELGWQDMDHRHLSLDCIHCIQQSNIHNLALVRRRAVCRFAGTPVSFQVRESHLFDESIKYTPRLAFSSFCYIGTIRYA